MNSNNKKKYNWPGFTMLELVIIVTVILVLGAAVVIWIDPVERIGDAKQARRQDDVMTLSAAFSDYAISHNGALPILGAVTTEKKVICNNQTGVQLVCDASTEYCLKIDDADFFTKNITNLPIDPDKSSDSDTGYYIAKDVNNNIIIGACDHTFGYAYDRPQLRSTCDMYAGGACWYSQEETGDCNTVCANNSKVCISGVSYGPDTSCMLSDLANITYDCSTDCGAMPAGEPPFWLDDNSCGYQTGIIDCAQASLGFPVCPCK
jgi:type II secretory pathway pseudopilin PulG